MLIYGCRYFADRDIFCAGRVSSDDLERVVQAVGGSIQSTCSDIQAQHLGTCERFEERQIGGERFNFFEGCPKAKTCTLVLRGGAEQFIAEVERSLHDAIMIVKRAIRNNNIVAGGGACEVGSKKKIIAIHPTVGVRSQLTNTAKNQKKMEISAHLHSYADKNIPHKQQAIIKSFAKALEIIPRQLCDNAGFDSTDILNRLRVEHVAKRNTWAGVDFDHEGVANNLERFVWEPSLVKINAIQAATEASCLILSVDETISEFFNFRLLFFPCSPYSLLSLPLSFLLPFCLVYFRSFSLLSSVFPLFIPFFPCLFLFLSSFSSLLTSSSPLNAPFPLSSSPNNLCYLPQT